MKEVTLRCVVIALFIMHILSLCVIQAAVAADCNPIGADGNCLSAEQLDALKKAGINNFPPGSTVEDLGGGMYHIKSAGTINVVKGAYSVSAQGGVTVSNSQEVGLDAGTTATIQKSSCSHSITAGAGGASVTSTGEPAGNYQTTGGMCGQSSPIPDLGQVPTPAPPTPPTPPYTPPVEPPATDTPAPSEPSSPASPPAPSTPSIPAPEPPVITWPGSVVGGEGGEAYPPGGAIIDDAESIEFGAVDIFDGHNIVATSEFICGESAGSIFIRGDITTNAEGFCVHKKQVDVRHAESMMVRCQTGGSVWSTSNVSLATLTVDQDISLRSDAAQTLEITDCAGREINVTLMGNGSQVTFERDALEMAAHNAQMEFEGDEFTVKEVANATGWGHIVFDKPSGKVQFVVMDPDFSYRFLTKTPGTDFAFHATGGPHTLWIRRTPDEPIPQDVRGCVTCSIVDLPAKTITLKADIAYERRWVDAQGNALEDRYATVVRSSSPDNLVEMRMDKEFAIIEDLFVRRDAPQLFVAFSNHLNVTEMTVDGATNDDGETGADSESASAAIKSSTHRLLGVDDKAEPAQLSRTVVRSYRTAYSSATMTMDDAQAVYQRGSLVVKAYPAGSGTAKALVAGLLGINAMLALGALLLLPRKALDINKKTQSNKRAQITLFILLGLLMLFLIVLLLMSAGGSKQLRPADEAGVNGFLKDCGSQKARDTLVYIGSQGGTSKAPFARWFDQRMTPVPISEIEYVMSRDLEERMPSCLEAMRGVFSNIEGVAATAPSAETTITRDTVSFKVHYPLAVTLKDGTSFTVTDKMLVENNRLTQTINLALAIILSEQAHNGLIDLDALIADQATITLFPHEKQLLSFIKDESYVVPYDFAIANRR